MPALRGRPSSNTSNAPADMYDAVLRSRSSVVTISMETISDRDDAPRGSSDICESGGGKTRATSLRGAKKNNAASATVGDTVINRNRTILFAGL